jgi:hypothetical protein
VRVHVADGGDETVRLPALGAGACVRVAAVAAHGSVDVLLVDQDGTVLASDGHPALSLAPLGGPACLGQAGAVVVHLKRGSGALMGPDDVWVQAWGKAP